MKKAFIATLSVLVFATHVLAAGEPFQLGKGSLGKGTTVITASAMEFDYNSWLAIFESTPGSTEQVVVTDPEFILKANRMIIRFEGTNDVQRVDCIGNVDMTREDLRARCGHAIFTREDGRVLLQESPVVMKGEQKIAGEQICIWLNDKRVQVMNGVRVEAHTDEAKKDLGSERR